MENDACVYKNSLSCRKSESARRGMVALSVKETSMQLLCLSTEHDDSLPQSKLNHPGDYERSPRNDPQGDTFNAFQEKSGEYKGK